MTMVKEYTCEYFDPSAMQKAMLVHRMAKNWSRSDLAIKLQLLGHSVSENAIEKWERGKSLPKRDNLAALCYLYECSVSELLLSRKKTDGQYKMVDGPCFDCTSVRKKLVELRKAHNLTQRELCFLFQEEGRSISTATINRWEKDNLIPGYRDMLFLCHLYGCSIDELFLTTVHEPCSGRAGVPVAGSSFFLCILPGMNIQSAA